MKHLLLLFLLIGFTSGDAFAASCPSGFSDVTSDYASTFYSRDSGTCPAGYEPYTAPSILSFSFDGLILDSAPTLCGAGYHYVNGSCVAYTADDCPAGYVHDAGSDDTFYSRDNNYCPAGYEAYTYGNILKFMFTGLITGDAPTVCASGYYVNGTCSTHSATGCTTGYIDMNADDIAAAVDANGDCPSGYGTWGEFTSCMASTTDKFCTTVCNGGMLHTSLGNCAAVCTYGNTELRTSTGLSFPLWNNRTTQPAIYIGYGGGICYVNLVPGASDGAVNVNYNGTVYHTVN